MHFFIHLFLLLGVVLDLALRKGVLYGLSELERGSVYLETLKQMSLLQDKGRQGIRNAS